MKRRGFVWFNMAKHTNVRDEFDAKNPKHGFGVTLSDDQWYYYDVWMEKVAQYCQEFERQRSN
jgi:hypothetical protein